jgi:succinoglycan biosynthesis transport protein ExoP
MHVTEIRSHRREPDQIRKDYKNMTPTQQIIPAPRSPEGRNSGRNALEVARPHGANRPHVEPTVNYAALLRRHRGPIAMIVGSVLVLAALYTMVAPKAYKTEAILEVSGQNGEFMNSKDLDPTSSAVSGDGYIETQTKLMKSPPVLQRTAEVMGPKVPASISNHQGIVGKIKGLFGKAPEATPAQGEAVVFGMLNGAKVKVDGGSDLVTLDVVGPEPQLTADAANELIEQFIEQAQELRGFNASNTNKFLTTQLSDALKKLQDSENALQDYARQANIVIPNESQESVAAD